MSVLKLYSENDKARWVPEPEEPYRSPFRRDYARLIHSPAFRRLQGKTQLFPGFESDFFRNRLTHSLEVAQVAKSIAQRLNQTVPEFMADPICLDIIEVAGLAHDLGHPPFGHNGERALDQKMQAFGGFEGNAQTLRILARLEKKKIQDGADKLGVGKDGMDFRAGLNMTARTLAAVLKYDRVIPLRRESNEGVKKGYYTCEQHLVDWIRTKVLSESHRLRELKTVECQIMDLADDIAYSTYDLEDAFKAGFLTPLETLAFDRPLREEIAKEVVKAIKASFTADDVLDVLLDVFDTILYPPSETGEHSADDEEQSFDARTRNLRKSIIAYQLSVDTASNGYARNMLTSQLVSEAVAAVEVHYDPTCPMLSKISLRDDVKRRVETLKNVAYLALIQTPRLKIAEYRGLEIIRAIFDALTGEKGDLLLPEDYQELYRRFKSDEVTKHRLICDFIAGMTDAYAIEFYARLKSENARTIFKKQ